MGISIEQSGTSLVRPLLYYPPPQVRIIHFLTNLHLQKKKKLLNQTNIYLIIINCLPLQ